MTVSLEARGLGMRYGRNWALRDCDLSIPAGRITALVGPNGAGKTTLLHLAVGLLRPTEGTITVLGWAPTAEPELVLARLGFVAQDTPLYRGWSVADTLHLGRSLNRRWAQEAAVSRLARLGIPLERRVGQLSGGQRAQVALALALAKRPNLLVLDEPMSSLDPLARQEFQQTLMSAVADGELTVLFSSHAVHELQRVCDHLVVINHGQVILSGDIDSLLAEHRLLVGPRVTTDPRGSQAVVEVKHSDRHTTLLVRQAAAPIMPGWQANPVGLEALVLAYLRRPVDAEAAESQEEAA